MTRATLTVLLSLLAITAIAFVLPLSVATAGDSLVIKDGDEQKTLSNIQIDDVLIDRVTFYDLRGGASTKQKKMVDIIAINIDYHGHNRSSGFGSGKDMMDRAEWVKAIQSFRKVLTDAKASRLEKHIAQVRICECAGYIGAAPTADGSGFEVLIREAKKFIANADYRNSGYQLDVLEWLGSAYQATRRPADAEQTFRKLASIDEARGTFQLARVLYHNSKYQDALDRFKRALVSAQGRDDDRTADRCQLYIGWCYFRTGKADEAKEIFETLVGEGDGGSDAQDVLGMAYLGLGRELGRRGDFQNAFFALARASTVFKGNLSGADQKEALGLCARAAQSLAGADADWRERAEKLLAKFKAQYGRGGNNELPDWD